MAYPDSESDHGRRGSAKSREKGDAGYQYTMPNPKGRFMPAYGGGRGECAQDYDPDIGQAEDEVGNDADAAQRR